MTLRDKRRLLWTACAGLAAALVGVNAALLFTPLDDPRAGATEPKPAPEVAPRAGPERPPLEVYAAAWACDLQRPLFDPEPVLVNRVPPPPPKPTVRLLGTIIEPGHTFAFLRGKDGSAKCVSVGEALDGAEVIEVRADSVVVRFAGQTHTIEAEKPAGSTP